MKFKRLFAMIAGLGLMLLATPPAYAEPIPDQFGGGYIGVRFGDFRYPGASCYTHRGYLDVAANDDYAYEDFTVELDMQVRSNGQWVDGWYDYAEWSDTYTLDAYLCRGTDPTGTYDVSGTVTFSGYQETYDPDCDCVYDEYVEESVYITDSFVVRAPHTSALAVAKAAYGAHGWKITGAVKYDGRYWAGKRVYLQRKTSSGWSNMTSKTSNGTGRVYFYYTPPAGRAKYYRLYIAGSAGAPAKATGAFLLKRR